MEKLLEIVRECLKAAGVAADKIEEIVKALVPKLEAVGIYSWEALVRRVVADGIVNLILGVVFIGIVGVITYIIYRMGKPLFCLGSMTCEGEKPMCMPQYGLRVLTISVLLTIGILVSVFIPGKIERGITNIVAPESQVISILTGEYIDIEKQLDKKGK